MDSGTHKERKGWKCLLSLSLSSHRRGAEAMLQGAMKHLTALLCSSSAEARRRPKCLQTWEGFDLPAGLTSNSCSINFLLTWPAATFILNGLILTLLRCVKANSSYKHSVPFNHVAVFTLQLFGSQWSPCPSNLRDGLPLSIWWLLFTAV